MKFTFGLIAIWFAVVLAQTQPECTRDLAKTDECASVINANACYNQFKFNTQTLTCIDGKDAKEKQAKA